MKNAGAPTLAFPPLNFHHLFYFWAVARSENLTSAARTLRVSQSALSSQIRQLEERIGRSLFTREGRGMTLSEAGRIALRYADDIFATGHELFDTLHAGRKREQTLRIGAVATLSRNFQESFVKPLLAEPDVTLQLRSGTLTVLLEELGNHEIDVLLSNRAPARTDEATWHCRTLARQPVSLVGHVRRKAFRFPADLREVAVIVPGRDSDVGAGFHALAARLGIALRVLAEVDDMATIRLLARDSEAVALVPSVVVRDELRSGILHEYCVVPALFETFYAVTAERHYPHPLLQGLLARDGAEILAMEPRARRGKKKR